MDQICLSFEITFCKCFRRIMNRPEMYVFDLKVAIQLCISFSFAFKSLKFISFYFEIHSCRKKNWSKSIEKIRQIWRNTFNVWTNNQSNFVVHCVTLVINHWRCHLYIFCASMPTIKSKCKIKCDSQLAGNYNIVKIFVISVVFVVIRKMTKIVPFVVRRICN